MGTAPAATRSMKRAIGITRVSAEGDRETIHSYTTQADRITASCQRDGLQLLHIGQERNVSGGASLVNRPELSKAVEAVEAGEADVIVAAYFDRFFRSLEVQSEVVRRVEKAGGEVLALDHGQLTNATPAKRMTANIMGAIAQFYKEQTGEKVRESHRAAVAAGKLPHPYVPLGYRKGADGVLLPDKATAGILRELFRRRAHGESITSLGRWITAQGHRRTTFCVRRILSNRVYLGELHFGEHMNLAAHEPLIDSEQFALVQRMKSGTGRPTLSEPRLLARLGVLYCSCGAALAVGHNRARGYAHYRCSSNPRCGSYVSISAPVTEQIISDIVKDALRDAHGTGSIAESAQEAVSRLSSAQATLESALRVFELTGAENESAAVERIKALREARDTAQAEVDRIRPERTTTVSIDDWDDLSFDGRRAIIRAAVKRAVVAPATVRRTRSRAVIAERITVELSSGLSV